MKIGKRLLPSGSVAWRVDFCLIIIVTVEVVMDKYTVIVSGGMLEEEFALRVLNDEHIEFIIAADSGLLFLHKHHIEPDYIVGDFDSAPAEVVSYYKEQTNIPIRQFDPVKDFSDTEIALRLCLNLGRKHILILGGTGSRIDHIWSNVQILKIALDAGAGAWLLDSHNRIRLIDRRTTLRRETAFGPYFSVFPLGGTVEYFSIKGAKYPLTDHALTPYDSLCVSNEYEEDEVEIAFPETLGNVVVLMETRD